MSCFLLRFLQIHIAQILYMFSVRDHYWLDALLSHLQLLYSHQFQAT